MMLSLLPLVGIPTPGRASAAPEAPGQPVAVARPASAVVAVPLPFAGTTATSITVTADPDGATCTIDPAATPRTCTVSGLDDGTAYTFSATATNGAGTSASSPASDPVTPRATYAIVEDRAVGGSYANAMAIDAAGEYAYVAVEGYPGSVRKVRLSDLTTVRTRTLEVNDQRPISIVLDPAGVYGYLGGAPSTTTSVSPVTRFRLSDLARIDRVSLSSGEATLQTAVIEPDGGHAYFSGYYGANSTRVVKVDLDPFSRVGSVRIADISNPIPGVLNWDTVGAAVMDPAGTYAYFLSDTDPGAVFRIRLSDFTLQGRVVLASESERYPSEAVITADGSTMLVLTGSWPGRIVTIDLDTFTRTGSTTYTTQAPRGFAAGALDADGEYLYAVGDDPSWAGTIPNVLRIRLSDMAVVGTVATDEFRTYRDVGIGTGGRELFVMSRSNSEIRFLRVRIAEEEVGLPGAPGAATATADVGEATVSWSAPSDLGGFELLGYHVEQATDGGAWASAGDGCAPAVTSTSSATTCTVTGLAKSVPVAFRVTALGTAGAGAVTLASDAVTPTGVPDAPTGVAGTPGVGSVAVSWTAPADDGSSTVTSSTVTAAPGGATCTAAGTATSCTVTGLDDDTSYTFSVTATNAVGASAASTASAAVTTPALPGAPRAVAAVAGVRSAEVSWNAPLDDGRDDITSYRATASPGGRTCTAAAPTTSCTVTALSNDTAYTFTVTATNGVGTGAASMASVAVSTPSVPGPPTAVTAVRGDTVATVSWSDPADDGGEDLTSATVTSSPGGRTCTASAPSTSCTVTGLTNGTGYTFTVTATTAVGTGPASDASDAVTPAGLPSAPTITGISRGVGALVVEFSAAGANGSSLLRYDVALDGGAWVATDPVLPSGSFTVDGLDDDTSYSITLRAVNDVGEGAGSAGVSGTTAAVPGAPTVTAVTAGDERLTVAWDAPAANGSAIVATTVTAAPGGATCTAVAPATSCDVTGLTNGTSYTVTATATNGVGEGEASAPSAAASPLGLPLAPVITAVRSGARSLTVEFDAADGNGATINGYEYRLGELDWVVPDPVVTASPLVIAGLSDDAPYRVTVRAVSDIGAGAASEAMLGRTLPAPAAPPRGPVRVDGGALPALSPGARSATLGGRSVEVVAAPVVGALRLEVGGTSLRLAFGPGSSPVVVRGGALPIEGTGFAPDSIVEVWLFSDPQLLALLRADAGGGIAGEVPLDGWSTGVPIPPGRHTLQIGGTTADGELLGVSLGVEVAAPVGDAAGRGAATASSGSSAPMVLVDPGGVGDGEGAVGGGGGDAPDEASSVVTDGAPMAPSAAPAPEAAPVGAPVAEPASTEAGASGDADPGGALRLAVLLLAIGGALAALLVGRSRRVE